MDRIKFRKSLDDMINAVSECIGNTLTKSDYEYIMNLHMTYRDYYWSYLIEAIMFVCDPVFAALLTTHSYTECIKYYNKLEDECNE